MDWIEKTLVGMFLFMLALFFILLYAVITGPDTITRTLPDGRTVVCTNAVHSECDWENAQ